MAASRPQIEGGTLPIDISTLRHYVDYFKIRRLDEREEIFLFVGFMDEEYCDVMREKQEEPVKLSK